jgi:acetylornithine deacetylase/succinyl-diaminopimelate desuccinylase-like protein
MDDTVTRHFVEELWDDSIVAALVEYIRIPNKSPLFDSEWASHGHMDEAVSLIEGWCRAHAPADTTIEVMRLEGRTPLIYMDVPGSGDDCLVLYGHLDKQPEMHGWREGLGPWTPVLEGERLFGRGGADDGYAAFACLAALGALRAQGIPHARSVILIEACEESGSYDLPYYIDALSHRIGTPSLVVCLDSGCGNYDQLWCTTSLRGIASGDLTVEILTEGVHSGDAGGIVPSSFRIARELLSRIEDERTGAIIDRSFSVDIPAHRVSQAREAAAVLGEAVYSKFPFVGGAGPAEGDPAELVLNRTWRPALEITGASGIPSLEDAGNVARPMTTLRLSLRLPPTCEARRAAEDLKRRLEADSPNGAQVRFVPEMAGDGWSAPAVADWLEASMAEGSRAYFGADAVYMGEGGTIPFMGMLGEKFPEAQFLVTGVLGPGSNAHGPNEFLHIPTGKKVTCCVARVIRDHFLRND